MILAVAMTLSCQGAANAQALGAVGTALRGKSLLEFYEATVEDPSQVLVLAGDIQTFFRKLGHPGYKGLNDEGVQVHLLGPSPLSKEWVDLSPEPSPAYEYGFFSITLKRLKFKQCEIIASNFALNGNFLSVELNGRPVSINGQQLPEVCRSQWPFQDGKNSLRFISN